MRDVDLMTVQEIVAVLKERRDAVVVAYRALGSGGDVVERYGSRGSVVERVGLARVLSIAMEDEVDTEDIPEDDP